MLIQEIKQSIDSDLAKGLVSPRILLHDFLLLTEDSRRTPAYLDPTYTPFYYHLGKYIEPKNVLEIGLRLGLLSGCFFRSCKTAEYFAGFQTESSEFYSTRLAVKNITRNFRGKVATQIGKPEDLKVVIASEKWDLVIVNEELGYDTHREYLELVWGQVNLGGIIVVDYVNQHEPAGKAFKDFCKVVNREPTYLKTRYGVGLVQR